MSGGGVRRSAIAFLLMVISMFPQAASAADGNGQFAIRGAGLISCAMYAREHDARGDIYKIVSSWVDGYITGINQFSPDAYDWLPFETTELLLEIVDRHCKTHPSDPVFGVLENLFGKLKDERLREKSEKITISVGKYKADHYVELIRRVQRALKKDGFYGGDVNGEFTPETSSAVGAFQKSIGFEPTGFPDQATLWRLLRSG